MLKGISPILSPELLKIIAEMGHGDELVLADGNFPGTSIGKRCVRCDGHGCAEVMRAIVQLFPKTEVTVGGVTYEYFVVDLEITVDGKVRVERYGFRYDEELGQWVFEKLDLIDMHVEAE